MKKGKLSRSYKRHLRRMKPPKIKKFSNESSMGIVEKNYVPNVDVYTVSQVEQKFGCKLETKHGYLPMTNLPNSDLVAESVILLSNSFGGIHKMSSTVIVSSKKRLASEEKKVISYLIDEANNAPICDDDDEGFEILMFFPNAAVTIVDADDPYDPNYEYMGLTSKSGYAFDLISDKDKFFEMRELNPENAFLVKIVDDNVARKQLEKKSSA